MIQEDISQKTRRRHLLECVVWEIAALTSVAG
jgi:hypothetical protein